MKYIKIFVCSVLVIMLLYFSISYIYSLYKTTQVANCSADVFPSGQGKNIICNCGNGYSLWCNDGDLSCVKDGNQVYGRFCDEAGILLPESNWKNPHCCE